MTACAFCAHVSFLRSPQLAAAVSSCEDCVIGKAASRRCPFVAQQLPARSVVCSQGELPGRVIFVRDGLLALASTDSVGGEGGLTLRGPRSLLCLEALLGLPAPTEIRALSDVKLCCLSSGRLMQWVGPESSPGRAMVALLLSELHQRQQDLGWLQGKSLTRLARYLLARDLWPEDGRPLRKQTLARLLGMRPETLSRCLRQLVARGVIDAGREHRVRDVTALKAVSSVRN